MQQEKHGPRKATEADQIIHQQPKDVVAIQEIEEGKNGSLQLHEHVNNNKEPVKGPPALLYDAFYPGDDGKAYHIVPFAVRFIILFCF